MSLTVKHLNSDASFLLTFSSNSSKAPTPSSPDGFTVLLDPWLSGTSKIWIKSFSLSTHNVPSCIETLAALPQPDIVIISQDKTDHCHEATLKQLPASGTKTLILAEPGAARTIRSWKYFEAGKVITLPRWEDACGKAGLAYRIPVPPLSATGAAGEVTVAYIPQKYDLNGLHSAVGITYRPPTDPSLHLPSFLANLPLTPPASPITSFSSTVTPSPKPSSRVLSALFSPHGINSRSIAPYATAHLAAESALPLTALLHCFYRVQNPWWFGGNICSGADSGKDIARMLNARAWVSAHDGDKLTTGWASALLRITRVDREEIEEAVSPRREVFSADGAEGIPAEGTRVKFLDVGEEWHL